MKKIKYKVFFIKLENGSKIKKIFNFQIKIKKFNFNKNIKILR